MGKSITDFSSVTTVGLDLAKLTMKREKSSSTVER